MTIHPEVKKTVYSQYAELRKRNPHAPVKTLMEAAYKMVWAEAQADTLTLAFDLHIKGR